MSDATFTFRVDKTLKSQFGKAAKARDRTGAQLLRDFMRSYVSERQEASEDDGWLRQQVKLGRDAANAGEVISAKEVEAEAAAWRRATKRKLAGARQ